MTGRRSRGIRGNVVQNLGQSLGLKLLGGLLILVLVLTITVFLFEARQGRQALREHAESTLMNTLTTVEGAITHQHSEFLRTIRLAVDSFRLAAPATEGIGERVVVELNRMRRDLDMDTVSLINADGESVFTIGTAPPRALGSNFSELLGSGSGVRVIPTTGDRYLLAVIVPMRVGDDAVALLAGQLFGDAAAARFRQLTGEEMVLSVDGEVVGTTLQDPPGNPAPDELGTVNATPNGELVAFERVVSRVEPWTHEAVVGVISADPLRELDQQLFTNRAMAFLVLATLILLAGALAYFRIARPLSQLAEAAERVGAGELEVPFEFSSADEVGRLARSIDRMRHGLAEQLATIRDQADALRRSRTRVVTAADEARRRIERNLHDGAQQNLLAATVGFQNARNLLAEGNTEEAADLLRDLEAGMRTTLAELRALAQGVYPPSLEAGGIREALGEIVSRSSVPVTLDLGEIGRYPRQVESAVYFCCAEAVQNITRHAGDHARADISAREENGRLLFSIRDDGVGFDPGTVENPRGLLHLQDRVGSLGGDLTIESSPGGGTTVTAWIPTHPPA